MEHRKTQTIGYFFKVWAFQSRYYNIILEYNILIQSRLLKRMIEIGKLLIVCGKTCGSNVKAGIFSFLHTYPLI